MEKTICILAVDDDDKILRVLEALLVPYGYKVIFANNGKEAITIMAATKPDLVLLDIFMPIMDGYTTLQRIKSDSAIKDIPVVMVTAIAQELNKKLAISYGAVGYVTKPFKAEELVGAINNILQ